MATTRASCAAAARAGEEAGYDEINLNCGCPSDRVSSGAFGACLMREPGLVADCVAEMRAHVRVPVTVKMRIGVVDTHAGEPRGSLATFDEADFERCMASRTQSQQAGCEVAIVHARKAVLGGLRRKTIERFHHFATTSYGDCEKASRSDDDRERRTA